MGEALKRMSGSVVVTDCNDFDAAIMDEVGDVVQVGLYNTELAASLDMAANWTLRHRATRPGIGPGDMFLCNDPWVGAGLHQNDVSLFAPLFIGGELFPGTGAVAHQVDLGGVSPGSWSVGATDVFWESIPIPPVKSSRPARSATIWRICTCAVRGCPSWSRSTCGPRIGANNVAHDRLRALCEKYGAPNRQSGHAPSAQ